MSESIYMAKCKRIRTDGPTPCLCCAGECFGDVCTYPGCDCAFEWGSVMPMPRTVCLKVNDDPPLNLHFAMYGDGWPSRIVAVLAILAWLALVVAAALPPRHNVSLDTRDARCDTAARYQAMSEGADCS